MKGEGDIVALSVPFAAGLASGAVFLALPWIRTSVGGSFAAASVAGTALAAALLLLLRERQRAGRSGAESPRGGEGRSRRAWVVTAAVFVLLGFFCALADGVGGRGFVGAEGPSGRLVRVGAVGDEGPVARAAAALRGTVDAVPYPSPATGPLVKALTTGDRSDLDRETVRVFRRSGASHLLALSGLHLGILYLLLLRAGACLGNRPAAKRFRSFLLVAAAGAYTLVTGASPSLVRAFLFILLGETARLLGRPQPLLRIFCGALLLQLAFRPAVIGSVGFQLSYLAMAGLALLYPKLKAWYPAGDRRTDRWNLPRRMWEAMALAISCQVFTAPLVWYHFRTFPPYFLLTNLLALPLTTGLMFLSAACVGLTALGCCPAFLVVLNDRAAVLLLQVLGVIAAM